MSILHVVALMVLAYAAVCCAHWRHARANEAREKRENRKAAQMWGVE